ncbi:hypothetical protein [Actinopolyspora lacussalsi]|nr:hypothetical protein [Actinopolyspora righensis]
MIMPMYMPSRSWNSFAPAITASDDHTASPPSSARDVNRDRWG